MDEGNYVRTLSVILVYNLVYYFLHVSVMDKQFGVLEVILQLGTLHGPIEINNRFS